MAQPDNQPCQPGDLALCVRGGKILSENTGKDHPQKGTIYTVEKVGEECFKVCGVTPALWLKDAPMNIRGRVWPTLRFVRLPPHEEDEEDRETIRLLNEKRVPCVPVKGERI